MGETAQYQSLTAADRATVVLYRAGIALSALVVAAAAVLLLVPLWRQKAPVILDIGLVALYASTGLSVFFIHLYVGSYKRFLKRLYYLSLLCLVALFVAGKGNVLGVLSGTSWGGLLLIPLSLCLGFVAAKEAFCFRLLEGYLLAIMMPVYFLFLGRMTMQGAAFGLLFIAVVFGFFTLRKVFQPLHFDIGDKSAYQP